MALGDPGAVIGRLSASDAALWEAMGEATPRYTPTPTPGAANELRAVETITASLGQRLLPWQRWTVRVLTEKRADDPRRYRVVNVLSWTSRVRYPSVTRSCTRRSARIAASSRASADHTAGGTAIE